MDLSFATFIRTEAFPKPAQGDIKVSVTEVAEDGSLTVDATYIDAMPNLLPDDESLKLSSFCINRIIFMGYKPSKGDVFYIRTILAHQNGLFSQEELDTIKKHSSLNGISEAHPVEQQPTKH